MTVCETCRGLQPDKFDATGVVKFYHKTSDDYREGRVYAIQRSALKQSAQAGCETCLIIWDASKFLTTSDILSAYKTYICILYADSQSDSGGPLCITRSNEPDGSIKLDNTAELYTLQGGEASKAWPYLGVGRHVLDDPLSPAAMDLAAEWMKDCLSNHDSCQRPLETELPTRVIDVGRDGDNPQLFIANGAKGHYVTLSHRWGESTPLTTTMSTLGKRVNGITMAELPRTFQDAVRYTRYLGYKYLWIDSLCIIQDSKVDWEHESSQMEDIYTRAILNISANAAHDSTSGLGSSKRLAAGKPVGGSSNGDYVHVRELYSHTDSSGVSHVPQQDEGFEHALQTRGWVLQERMLSPRILHFSAYEMAWECDTFCRCECATSPRKPTARPFRTLLLKSELDFDSHIAWCQLLRNYNTLKLTYESDKLLAFTGLAYKAAEFFRKTYLAGLWKEDLSHSSGTLGVVKNRLV